MSEIEAYLKSAEACFVEELSIHDDTTKQNLLLASIAQSTLAIAKMLDEWRKADEWTP